MNFGVSQSSADQVDVSVIVAKCTYDYKVLTDYSFVGIKCQI